MELPSRITIEKILSRTVRNGECVEWQGASSRGYGQIGWKENGKNIMAYVHRAIWYLNNGDLNGLLVCHKCDNRLCVNIDHLFLGTQKENMVDCRAKGRLNRSKGSNHYGSKLDEHEVAWIKRIVKTGKFSRLTVAKMFKVCRATINHIVNGRIWKHVGH